MLRFGSRVAKSFQTRLLLRSLRTRAAAGGRCERVTRTARRARNTHEKRTPGTESGRPLCRRDDNEPAAGARRGYVPSSGVVRIRRARSYHYGGKTRERADFHVRAVARRTTAARASNIIYASETTANTFAPAGRNEQQFITKSGIVVQVTGPVSSPWPRSNTTFAVWLRRTRGEAAAAAATTRLGHY